MDSTLVKHYCKFKAYFPERERNISLHPFRLQFLSKKKAKKKDKQKIAGSSPSWRGACAAPGTRHSRVLPRREAQGTPSPAPRSEALRGLLQGVIRAHKKNS